MTDTQLHGPTDHASEALDTVKAITGAKAPASSPPSAPPEDPKYERPASVLGMQSLRELRHVCGIEAHELGNRIGLSTPEIHQLEDTDLELLDLLTIVRYVQGMNMQLTVQVDLTPRSPLSILSTRR